MSHQNQSDENAPTSRRKFLKLGVATAAAVGAGSAGTLLYHEREGVAWHLQRLERAVVPVEDRIRSHFSYLQLDEAGLAKYGEWHRKLFGSGFDARRDPMFYERFLLSTDFFKNGADESQPIRFLSFYDPYISPCWNPCADLSLDAPEGSDV